MFFDVSNRFNDPASNQGNVDECLIVATLLHTAILQYVSQSEQSRIQRDVGSD
jgi:hypothetical protein